MRERVDQLGVAEPEIQRFGRDQISVGLPDVKNAERAQRQVGKVAQLFFYDWEKNVLGPTSSPTPATPTSTGGPQAGQVGGLSLYDAVKRASKRPPIKDGNNTTNDQYYLFGPAHQHGCSPGRRRAEADLVSELPRQRKPENSQVLKVNTGTVIIKGEKPDGAPKGTPDHLLRPQRRPGSQRHGHQEPRAEHRPGRRGQRRADRHVRVHRQGTQEVGERDARDRPARPLAPDSGAAARRVLPALRRGAGRRDHHRARSSLTSTTPTASTGAPARRSKAGSRSPRRRTWPSCSRRAPCRSSSS